MIISLPSSDWIYVWALCVGVWTLDVFIFPVENYDFGHYRIPLIPGIALVLRYHLSGKYIQAQARVNTIFTPQRSINYCVTLCGRVRTYRGAFSMDLLGRDR